MDSDELLNVWFETKQKISELEKNIEKYKLVAEKIMDENNIDSISNDKYTLQKKNLNRTSIGKSDLPIDIWNKYSKESFYNAYYITKKRLIKRSTNKKRNLNN